MSSRANQNDIDKIVTLGNQAKDLYSDDKYHYATILIHKGLFLEYESIVNKLTRDSWKIYSSIIEADDLDFAGDNNEKNIGYLNECLNRLSESRLSKSFLRLTFHQIMKFILCRSKAYHLVDLQFLLGFINELRTAYSASCVEDKQIFKPTLKAASGFHYNLSEDASFLIYWATIEAAKYCMCQKFAPDSDVYNFLRTLSREISSSVAIGDKVSRRFLVNFLLNLDKFLDSSTLKRHTLYESSVESFLKANTPVLNEWFLERRRDIAQLSLTVDNPAEAWRNISKLFFDMTVSFYQLGFRDKSLAHNFARLNARYNNLCILSMSAKQLQDIHLLYGIRTLCVNYQPLDAIISNLEGHFQQTYDHLRGEDDLEEQTLIEFLDSCIELNLLDENKEFINDLSSICLKDLYKHYLNSRSQTDSALTRFAEVQKWLSSWSDLCNDNSMNGREQRVSKCMDLIIPTCLNLITKAPENQRLDMIESSEWLVSQDWISQTLYPPCFINKNIKIYNVLFDLVKGMDDIPKELLHVHADDLQWNNILYRHLTDLELVDKLRINQKSSSIDFIQFRAAKFNRKHDNTERSIKITEDLIKRTRSEETKILSSFLLGENLLDIAEQHSHFQSIVQSIKESNLTSQSKSNLMSKALRRILRLPVDHKSANLEKLFDQEPAKDLTDPKSWTGLLDSCSLQSRTKTYLVFSKNLAKQLQSHPTDARLLNINFNLYLKLLELLCQSDMSKHKANVVECAANTLKQISLNSQHLNSSNLDHFTSSVYLDNTAKAWRIMKTNLISLVTYKTDLSKSWRDAIIKVLKHLCREDPFFLIYNVIVNRLDLLDDLNYLKNESNCELNYRTTLLVPSSDCTTNNSSQQESRKKLEESQSKLCFWNDLFDELKASSQLENNWSLIASETERFLRELRKISFLCSEYFKTITVRIPRRLHHFLDYFSRFCDAQSGRIVQSQRLKECENRLTTICDDAIRPIKNLICYAKKTLESPNSTKYDTWFAESFSKHLLELEYRINLLSNKKSLVLIELEKLIKSITELFAVCRTTLLQYNQNNRQKLYMELISPLLSRLEPSLIPMPDCCNNLSASNLSKKVVTIFKISQTVNLIVSKTSPKKLKLIGSDGISRSFLLKAHEDLRLDQLIMNLFGVINSLLAGSKSSQGRYRAKLYSVTPVSSRSGLIQWIEAPSLCSSYRNWLNSEVGKEVLQKLYKTTCHDVCDAPDSSSLVEDHTNCTLPPVVQTFDPFYQLLWAETKSTKINLTEVRPSSANSLKYRNEFDSSVFLNVVEKLAEKMPKELLSNQLWYKSHNSFSYWMKTQRFIHSCATMSILGYIIGLGDRHPENILLDYNTGELIHIDYNICFELGRTLPVPEKVPFRLTHDIIQAFGFAGLEGGFRHSCCTVLGILKDYRSTILHLLEPVNLTFMIGQPTKTDDNIKDVSKSNTNHRKSINVKQSAMKDSPRSKSQRIASLDMCSQELVYINPNIEDINDLLISNNPLKEENIEHNCDDQVEIKSSKIHASPSLDLQHNIKTPTKILAHSADYFHERIRDKLCGMDELIGHHKYRKERDQKQARKLFQSCGKELYNAKNENSDEDTDDLIMLDDVQTTEDQVDALIFEATSLKHKSAMYEGWIPWI